MSIAEPLLFPDPDPLSPQRDESARQRRDPVPQRGPDIERCVAGAHHPCRARDPRRGRRGRQRSEDGSAAMASAAGARVFRGPPRLRQRPWGAPGGPRPPIVMADADRPTTSAISRASCAQLEDGADLVMGSRMHGILPGAMPWHHRYIGNPVLSGLSTSSSARRLRRPLRHARLRRDKPEAHELRTTGMEFASEMVIKAALRQKMRHQPRSPSTLPSRRARPAAAPFCARFSATGGGISRFMLLFSPTHLFLIPGAAHAARSACSSRSCRSRPHRGASAASGMLHSMIAGSLLAIVGTQVLALGLCAHAYGSYFMGEREPWFDRMRARFRLEHGLLAGGAIAGAGALIAAVIVLTWIQRGFGVALRGAAPRRRLGADHRRAPDPLLVVPPQHSGSAPPRRPLDGYLGQASRATRRYGR